MTILGVLIGVFAVIMVNTILEGFKEYTESSIDKIGTNIIFVSRWASHADRENARETGEHRENFDLNDAYGIIESCDLVAHVSVQKRQYNNTAKYGNRIATSPDDYRGVWPEHAIVTNRSVDFGRFINEVDQEHRAMVTVLGPEIADALFDERADALGKVVKLNGRKFTVIGVQEEIDDMFGISENDYFFIPLSTFEKLYPSIEEVTIMCSAVSKEAIPDASDQITNSLRRTRRVATDEDNNFGLRTQDRFKERIGSFTGTVQLIGFAVSSVGLLVGLVGVMNIMLIAVTERTREIGIRKAIGARRADIMIQFLTEAVTLTGIGGLAGVVLGAAGGWGLTAALGWSYYLSPFWVAAGIILSAGTGIIAGTYPAIKAAKLDPIEALRYE